MFQNVTYSRSRSFNAEEHCLQMCNSGSMRDFLTVLALSFHSIFEGLAVGLESSVENVWKLFAGNIYTSATSVKCNIIFMPVESLYILIIARG